MHDLTLQFQSDMPLAYPLSNLNEHDILDEKSIWYEKSISFSLVLKLKKNN